jgi:hypothetical protein
MNDRQLVAYQQPSFSYSDLQKMAISMGKSNLFGLKDPDQILQLMLIAQAEGRHPSTVARDYDFIQGKAAKKAEAMQRDSLGAGMRVEWHELTDEVCEATFSHPAGGSVKIRWDMARAAKAGLTNKDNWKKYPRAMLRSRVFSEGCRTVCPMATSGMYTPEEIKDLDIIDEPVSIQEAVQEISAKLSVDVVEHYVTEMNEAKTMENLMLTFSNAYNASNVKDGKTRIDKDPEATRRFKSVYESRKAELESPSIDGATTETI